MYLPQPRGPISTALAIALTRSPHALPATVLDHARSAVDGAPRAGLSDEDLQLSLWICYELSYRGFDDVDDAWESDLSLLGVRATLETRLVAALQDATATHDTRKVGPADIPAALTALIDADEGPPLALYLQRQATTEQFAEFVAHRSIYHLKEADPHSWAIPRIGGRAKAALVEIQADEYGGGRVERMHSELFRTTMRGLGLDDTYGAYLDQVPAVTLGVSNTMSLFGLHRRWTPALLGHLAVFEMTSSLPNRRYGNGLRRLGYDATTTHFYDEHVEADAVHEQIAAHDLCGSYAIDHPHTAEDILFGAACALAVDNAMALHLLHRWDTGDSALLARPDAAAA
ncbi:iron-containing redox enzyme family protein [Amycolatopsis sp. H20-H5]|uniref:iron-containing redox enzyme family protein n=1 Tax=Amycolatopsis sp. H20-H5 TaxID=3046309 RepID=UPI002DB5AE70|nr:iron-containing redox enzyme family protein [Amycolatopsis sp. H20-H5]MEC3982765.1 iron-containing redox enzyme family protein [Amycolatopsis sp. H20-H5]